jgi:hypothetical protein
MNKIIITSILVSIVVASIGLVTAGNGFDPVDRTGECDNLCDSKGYDNCEGNCIHNSECNIACNGENDINQYYKGNCNRYSKSDGCC